MVHWEPGTQAGCRVYVTAITPVADSHMRVLQHLLKSPYFFLLRPGAKGGGLSLDELPVSKGKVLTSLE